MSYKFGQFRKSQYSDYLSPLDYTLNDLRVESSLSTGVVFIDKGIDLEGSNILQALTSDGKQRSYYLRFKVFKQDTIQKITVSINMNDVTINKVIIWNSTINKIPFS